MALVAFENIEIFQLLFSFHISPEQTEYFSQRTSPGQMYCMNVNTFGDTKTVRIHIKYKSKHLSSIFTTFYLSNRREILFSPKWRIVSQ